MTIEILNKDMVTAWKAGDLARKNTLANMIDAVKKASMTSKGRVEITETLVNETLIKYQKTVQEQYDTCPDSAEDPKREAELKQRKAGYLKELEIVKEYAPQMMTNYDQIKEAVMGLLSEYGPVDALSAKSNRGTVMKIVAPAMKGKADMSVVNKVVSELLV
jgi:uncharacterized protein YqeY